MIPNAPRSLDFDLGETADMIRLQALGVDGIITDYPDLIAEAAGYEKP